MTDFFISKSSGVIQSFPVPSGADWEKITQVRPSENHTYVEVSGVWQWVEMEDTRDFKHFTGQDKLDLFTESEQEAIMAAAYSGDIDVIRIYERFKIANYLTYSDGRTRLGLEALEAKDLITPERHQEIIAVMTAEKEG